MIFYCHVQVARSRILDSRVWRRARDYLGLMNEPAICLSVLGPTRHSHGHMHYPGTVNWNEGGTKMIAHIPFYILGEQEGKRPCHFQVSTSTSPLPYPFGFFSSSAKRDLADRFFCI